jgi:hypothetical protein
MRNPRDYISYSQLVSYESGRYYDEYILGNRRKSIEMDFGKKIADGLKNGSKDKDVEFVLMWTPPVRKREEEIVEIIDGIKIKAYLDGREKNNIYEYKTGRVPWTQLKVDNSDQLTVYSMLYWNRHRKHPKNTLIWIPTKKDGNKVMLTGDIPITFHTKRTIADYGPMIKRLKLASMGIKKLYNQI